MDVFPTDTTDFADYVLPAASFLESDDLIASYFDLTISAQAKVSDPMGESLPNAEIFRRLSAAMGYTEDALYEEDLDVVENVLTQTGVGETFDSLKSRGTVSMSAEPVLQFADLKFPTPSGKVEIASAAAEEDGLPQIPEAYADPRPSDGRLRLLSPASEWLLNDSFGNDPKIEKRLGGCPITRV